jgi:hypothetical protein
MSDSHDYLVITIPAGLQAGVVRTSSDKVIIKLQEPPPPAVHRPIKSNRLTELSDEAFRQLPASFGSPPRNS